MINEEIGYTLLSGDAGSSDSATVALTELELGIILGGYEPGYQEPAPTAAGATWGNSDGYRDGANQLVAAAGGALIAGIGIATAPISFPVALGFAAIVGIVGGVAAADATMDMRNAKPDNS